MNADEVILGGAAKDFAKRVGIEFADVKEARAGSVSELPAREFLILIGSLPDGRSIRMKCRHDNPLYVVTFRLI